MLIRKGTEQDLERCLDLSENFYATTFHKDYVPLDRDSCADYFRISINQSMLAVAEFNGVVQGFILAISSPFVVNKAYTTASELAWWIEPEYRNGSAGIKLLRFSESLAKKQGASFISMASLQASMPEKVHKLYSSQGYEHAESTYLKAV